MIKNKFLFCIRTILICLCAVIFLSQSAFALKKTKAVEVEIKSYDGFKLVGILDVPAYASVETKAPLVIFLHSICKSHKEWENLPKEIKESLNVATLNLNLRGHGLSVKDKEDKTLHWQNLNPADFKKMPEDILEVLTFIETEYPEINHKKVAIVGSSLGSTIGLIAASYVETIDTVIMFSPMLNYKGFDLRLPIVKYGNHPVLFLASKKDKYAYKSAEELMKYAQDVKKLEAYPFGGHGEDLLKFQPDSEKLVVKWLKEHFTDGKITATPGSKPATAEEIRLRKFKYKRVGEYFGKIKNDRDIYRGLH